MAPLQLVGVTRSQLFITRGFWVYVSGSGACRTLLDLSLIHFVVSLLSLLKHILGLADQRALASVFECVQLCSEGKIELLFGDWSVFALLYLL